MRIFPEKVLAPEPSSVILPEVLDNSPFQGSPMSPEEKAVVFEEFEWVARDVASHVSKRFDRVYEDMLDIAVFALVVELFDRRGYDPTKHTKLSSWLWRVVYYYLLEVCTRGKHPRQDDIREQPLRETTFTDRQRSKDTLDINLGENPNSAFARIYGDDPTDPEDRHHWLDNLLQEISEEARALVHTIVEAPAEIAHEFLDHRRGRPNTNRQREAVHAYLVNELDWSHAKFFRAWREVEACLA